MNDRPFRIHHQRRIFFLCLRICPRLAHELRESVAQSTIVEYHLDGVRESHKLTPDLSSQCVKALSVEASDLHQLLDEVAILSLHQFDHAQHGIVSMLGG